MAIELGKEIRDELTGRLQTYLREELSVELGSFDVEFLLDFFTREAGVLYYNQGLADAREALASKVEEFTEVIYALEQQAPE